MAVSPADWALIEELLPEALALPAPERGGFLRKKCGDALGLLAELEALVHAADVPDDLLRPIGLSTSEPDTETLPPGTVLGPWKIGEPIGHGGMGRVYAAERADGQFEMPAAVKVLKRGLDTDALLKRFVRERNILGRLSHPNIARLLDAGATADGRPYFVMERVIGEPITTWCRARHAGIPEILRLVDQMCNAVGAAHRALIVHRDLKPANVLVSSDGQVKLLDFGIAKLLADDEASHTLTAMESRLLTPSYAAPEQILGEPVSVVSDIYALGVLLFQLLTGQLPHRREGLPMQVLTAELRHETTARPSLAMRRASATPPAEAQRRARDLAGDLDLIVLKAMHAEPQRRYRSASELADDLARYLEHRPVLARPDSLAYRVTRFVQRYPLPVAAAAVAILALVTGLAVALWQAGVAQTEALRAEENLATARAVSKFVTQDLLASVDPDKRSTANITLKEMLDTAAGQVDKRFADRAQVAAELHHAIGQSYGGLGLAEEKRAHEASAARLFEQLDGHDAELALTARYEQGLATKTLGDLAGALAIQQEVYRGWLRQNQPENAQALLARLEISSLKEAVGGDLATAIAECRAVMEALERTHGPGDALRLAQSTLADNLETAAEYGEAEALYRKLLDSLARRPANRYLMRPRLMGSLAHVLIIRGRYDEAEQTLARLRTELAQLVPPTHDQFKKLNMYYALLRAEEGRFADAEASARILLDSKSELWGMVARVILADVYVRSNRYADAVTAARKVMDLEQQYFPPEDSSFVEVGAVLGDALRLAGRPREAASVLDPVAAHALPRLPERNPLAAQFRRVQGLLWLTAGKRPEAQAALAEALSIYQFRLGPEHWRTRRAREELARAGAG